MLEPSLRFGPGVTILRYVAYPLLLAAALATIVVSLRIEARLALVSVCFIPLTIAYLAVLEQIIPYDRSWLPEAWEWRRDGLYYCLTMVSGGLSRAAIAMIGSVVAPLRPSLPLWLEIPLAMLLLSLCSFGFHRLSHHHAWLWKLHGVHHATDKVNVANNSVNQFLDVALHGVASQLPLFLLGLSQPAVFAAGIFKAAQGYGVHANIDVRLGWLGYVLAIPEQHRLHHSVNPRESGHSGADLPIWDRLFSSFTWAPYKAPARVGLEDPGSFPPARSILRNQLHPFRRAGYLQRDTRS